MHLHKSGGKCMEENKCSIVHWQLVEEQDSWSTGPTNNKQTGCIKMKAKTKHSFII